MISSEQAFLYAIKSFPRWMSIRKYPRTSNGGKYLQSLIKEQDNINIALQKYIKDFFLATYIGREDTILDYGFIAQIGNVDIENTNNNLGLKITDNPRYFLNNRNTSCLLQDGYIILDPINVPEDLIFRYTYNNFKYTSKLTKVHIWNIFDEFALMSSLERFENETNKELMQRCFAVFKNKPNSTEQGIKNTIINTLTNYLPLTNSDIKIETLNQNNIYLNDDIYGNIYERLAQFNKDFFRTKVWDISLWEHNFKKLDFIPVEWDTKLDFYQIGTGQNNDLITKISDSNNSTTNLKITGYEASQILINDYIHKHNITKEIPLKLTQYKNELKSKTIEYKILASEVTKVEPTSVYLKSSIKKTGDYICYLEDIVTNTDDLTIVNPGKLTPGNYKLKFLPKNDYASMNIYYADIIHQENKTSLLKENQVFKFKDGILQNVDILGHINSLAGLKTYSNITEKNNTLTIGPESSSGELSIDISKMGGKPLNIKTSCKEVNYTSDSQFVTYNGFVLQNDILTASGTDSISNIIIDLDCSSLSFEFLKSDNPSLQGTISVLITIDNEVDQESGLWTSAKIYRKNFNKFCHIHVEIQKTGMNSVSIKNIMASRYRITKWLDYGELITTPFNTMLPNYGSDIKNNLHIKIESFSSYAPVIEYIHIGPSLKYASYEIDNISISNDDILKFHTDCKVELYLNNKLIQNNFTTYNIYKNETSRDILLEIDTAGFISINSSSKDILTTNYNGKIINYITINSKEEISYIVINGTYSIDKERKNINELLNLNKNDIVYVCSNSNGFIVVSENGQEKIAYIDRKDLPSSSDCFVFENLPNNITGCFVLDKTNNIINNVIQLDRNFEYAYLIPINSKEYIAYNSETMFTSELSNIDLVNTFSPLLDMSTLMFYKIDNIILKNINSKITVNFIKIFDDITEYSPWSLGNKKLHIVCNFDFSNINEYEAEAIQIKEIFTLSSIIELEDTYLINGKTEELAKYIIEPPNDMIINYDEETVSEDIIIEKDLFNKLYYSNIANISIVKINNQIVSNSIYDLVNDAGIIIWKDDTYVGQKAQIIYTYQKPASLSYKSLDSLYEIIGYSIDAYKIINTEPIRINNSKDGDKNIIDFDGKIPDKIIIYCDNPNFETIIDNNTVITKLIGNNNTVMVKTGYYYDNVGNEYYFFEHMKSDPIDKFDCIEFHYVKRTIDFLQFIQESTNYVLDSSMINFSHTEELCHIDLTQTKDIWGISSLNSLSACDSFQKWISFNMNVSISNHFNSPCLEFNPIISNDNYALLELSLNRNKILTFIASSSLNISILQEIKLNNDSMTKTIFARPYKNIINIPNTNIYYYNFENDDLSFKYYLFVQGNGYLDDILIVDTIDKIISGHNKNLDLLFNNITEKSYETYEHCLDFDINGNSLIDLEFNKKGTLQTGSNVDWGITQIYDIQNDLDKCILNNITLNHNAFYSNDKTGTLLTPKILLNNKTSIRDLYIAINNVIVDKLENFNIKVLTADNINNEFIEIVSCSKTNLLEVPVSSLFNYIQIEIEMPPNKIINSICVYARYAENKYSTPKITRNNTGSLISKLYDTTYNANFILEKFVGNISKLEYVELYIRGYKEDSLSDVWTDWYKCELDTNLKSINPHIFENYRFFQFKININNVEAKANIKKIVLKVVH